MAGAQRLNIHLFRATAQKKQQLLSSSQASCMATHSSSSHSKQPLHDNCEVPASEDAEMMGWDTYDDDYVGS